MLMRTAVQTFIKSHKGSSSIIIISTTFVVLIAAALATDIAYAAAENYKLAKGAREVARLGAADMAKNRISAEKVMKENAVKKVSGLNELDIKISSSNKEVTVRMGKPFEYIFLQYAGFKKKNLTTNVTARISGIAEFKGARPFAIKRQKLIYDKDYYLVDTNSNKADSVGFKALDFGTGYYRTGILYGYRKVLKTGSGVYPLENVSRQETVESVKQLTDKCRHQPACNFENYSKDCSRIVILPLVDRLEEADGEVMTVEGFTAFFIESAYIENQSSVIKGRFLKYTIDSRTNDAAPDFGLLGVEIIH